jgi:hypothetical protein
MATAPLRSGFAETSSSRRVLGSPALVQGRAVTGDPGVDEELVLVDQIQPVQLGRELAATEEVYAVLLAFSVFVVWQQFNDARGFVEKEYALPLVGVEVLGSRGLPERERGTNNYIIRAVAGPRRPDERRLKDIAPMRHQGESAAHE